MVPVTIKGGDVWMYLLVTVIAVLIWFWAAGETREQDSTTYTVHLAPSDPSSWVVEPHEFTVEVELAGSNFALEKGRALESLDLLLGNEITLDPGSYPESVLTLLDRHEPLRDTGVSVISATPASVQITVDRLVEVTALIQPVLPRVDVEGEITVTPTHAIAKIPAAVQSSQTDTLTVEAVVGQSLEPGRYYKIDAPLRAPSWLDEEQAVTITPAFATVEFTVRSRIDQITLPTVAVQVAGPWEDYQEYVVEIDERDKRLQNVIVKTDRELIRRIEQNEITVVAMVHLSNADKTAGIESKPVTCFMAIPRDGTAGATLDAEVDGATELPSIRLKISERKKE